MFVLRRLLVARTAAVVLCAINASFASAQSASRLRVSVALPRTIPNGLPAGATGLDGRLLVVFSVDSGAEPRFQVGSHASTQPAFAIDVTGWKPGELRTIDGAAFGFPVKSLGALPQGTYRVQAILNRYETFVRGDGHTVSLPPDQGEGQHWSSKPGNLYSAVRTVTIDPSASTDVRLTIDQPSPLPGAAVPSTRKKRSPRCERCSSLRPGPLSSTRSST